VDKQRIEADLVPLVQRVGSVTTPIRLDSSITLDLGLDSIRVLELVSEIEEHFDITVPLNELHDIKTVGDIVDRVHAKVQVSC
jgi:acyl carrier protein